jgi:SAM-dependent methyltransferase
MINIFQAMAAPRMNKHKEFAESHYGKTARDLSSQSSLDRYRQVLDLVSAHKFGRDVDRILDIGCGDGEFTALLKDAARAKEAFGVELSEAGAELAQRRNIRAVQLDIDESSFPFPEDYFELIFAGEVIEHLFDPDHLLEECHRVLKPAGIFIITTRNLSSFYNRITLLLGYQPFSTSVSLRHNAGRPFELSSEILGDHIRVFTYRALRDLVRLSKFEIIETQGSPSVLPERKSFLISTLRLFDRLLSRFPSLSQGILLVCKK